MAGATRSVLLGTALAVCAAMLASISASAQSAPRQIAPDIVAPPQLDPGDLTREAPRGPLSQLGTAGPPKPKKPKPGPNLYTPLAIAAGVVESKGVTVTVAGIEVVGVDETCSTAGKDWACGVRARTAFRRFLRGRAIFCELPPGLEAGAVSANCTLGRQDVGNWLVSSGWARAAAGGPYVEAGEKAKSDGRGIFGAAPSLAGLLPEPAPFDATSGDQPIMAPEPETQEPLPAPAATPPAGPQGLF